MAAQTPDVAGLQTMPGVGSVTALAIRSFAPPLEQFRSGRDFAAWFGLVPRQNSTGGKERLGRVSKMGQDDIRRLLVIGAMKPFESFASCERMPQMPFASFAPSSKRAHG